MIAELELRFLARTAITELKLELLSPDSESEAISNEAVQNILPSWVQVKCAGGDTAELFRLANNAKLIQIFISSWNSLLVIQDLMAELSSELCNALLCQRTLHCQSFARSPGLVA